MRPGGSVGLVFILIGAAIAGCDRAEEGFRVGEDYPPAAIRRGDTVIVAGPPSCAGCRITFGKSVILGRASDPVSSSTLTRVVRYGSGYLAGPLSGMPGVALYDSTGQFVRLIGASRGDGPRDLPYLESLLPAGGDTVIALDGSNHRLTVFGPDSSILGTRPLPATRTYDVARDSSGRIYIMAALRQGMEMGPPVHRVGDDGHVEVSFGSPMGPTPRNNSLQQMSRVLAVSPGGIIATGEGRQYRISIIRPGGSSSVFVRRVPWYLPWDTILSVGQAPARISSMWLENDHRLWVATTVIDKGADSIDYDDPDYVRKIGDTILEVIDLRSNVVLARARLDIPSMIQHGLIASAIEEADGNIYTRVASLGLVTSIKVE